ncbi:FecR family protein [Chitinophaga cymbidii]|uniref:Iron dicitrate transporter FecR n=1 Tax=Chitinophaga cymbidii TaxID=1096750 RepID=A0A512RJK8_9BACT|nr:FecR family protein [Chitinophaga cymbidii]GEP95868.1 hypothetical protein CCY01nite_21280 [Chitinophaga cymbidii]
MVNPESKKELQEMVDRYLHGKASPEEEKFVEAYFRHIQKENEQLAVPEDATLEERLLSRIHSAIDEQEPPIVPVRRRIWPKVAAAAAAIVAVSAAFYFFSGKEQHREPAQLAVHPVPHDVAPGGNKALLTLANGDVIALDSTAVHKLGGSKLNLGAGLLAYAQTPDGAMVQYNTLTTPRGGQFCVALADGSKVWLNAGSSLRYPTAFTGNERKVELTGEGYFEIAPQAEKPFKVQVRDMQVTVLGTHFNIMAYPEEAAIQTTLLEGAVQVSSGHAGHRLKPGQQAALDKQGAWKVLSGVNTEDALAWKNGMFSFREADVATIMRQLSRWYDVTVEYKGAVPALRFGGYVSRNSNLSQVLKILELSGLQFSMEEGKIIVLP